MVIGPRQEASLFGNRDKFDLVAVYDHSSTSFGSEKSPLNVIVRLIYEQAFRKMLKRSPIMLVGGFEAWKRDIGDAEIVRGQSPVEMHKPVPSRNPSNALLVNGNGHAGSMSPYTNGPSHTNDAQASHELWTPTQSRMDTGYSNGSAVEHHRPGMSLDQSAHARSV
jgi:ubiquitin carboxyl-terminal hydrolase 8